MASKSSVPRDSREEIDFDEIINRSPENTEIFDTAAYSLEGAQLVRKMREMAGLRKSELASLLRVSKTRIGIIERGDGPHGPTYALLKRIADACDVLFVVKLENRTK